MNEHSDTPYRQTFARLLGFLRPYKVSLIISIVLAVASQGAAIALIWVTKNVIDDAIAPHDSAKLWEYIWIIVGLGVLRAVLMAGRRLISGKQALAVEMEASALFAVGAAAGIQVACVLTVSDTFDGPGARMRIDDDALSGVDKLVDHVAADIAGPAGDQDGHISAPVRLELATPFL